MSYTAMQIRTPLTTLVDCVTEKKILGYSSRSDFVHEAIRDKLLMLTRLYPQVAKIIDDKITENVEQEEEK